jgi:hypothetical protein
LSDLTDEELVAEYRHIKDEPADGDDPSVGALEGELRRRGLEPDREDVIPDAPSSGRGSSSTPSRGTAPDAGEESSG